jgi:hypothetical protein
MTPGSLLEYTWLNVISVLQKIDQTGCADTELYLVFTTFFLTHIQAYQLWDLYMRAGEGQHIRGQFVVGMDSPNACWIQASIGVHPFPGWVWYQLPP